MRLFRIMFVLAAVSAVAACGGAPDHSSADSAAGQLALDSSGMPMHSMPSRAIGSGAMMEAMRAHLQTMRIMSADSMRGGLPMHRQMTDTLMAQMKMDMSGMKMPADPKWLALMDSVRNDVSRMQEMNSADLAKAVPAHHARLIRLMEMHQKMMPTKPPV